MPDRRAVFTAALIFFTTALLLIGAVFAVFRLRTLLLWILVAAMLSAALSPIAERVERRRRIPRAAAVAVVFLAVVLIAAGLVVAIGAPASGQIRSFMEDTNGYLYQVRSRWVHLQRETPWLPDLTAGVDRLLAYVKERARPGAGEMAAVGLGLLRTIGGVLTVLVLAFYMLLAPPRVDRWIAWLFPDDRRKDLELARERVGRRFQRWLRAQVILSSVVGLLSLGGFLALGMPYPHLLALIAAFGELFPTVGPVLAAVPAALVAMFISPGKTIGVIVLAGGIQLLENYLLVPQVMKEVVGLSPVATIIGLIAGFQLFGIEGAILAVPTVAALEIIIPEFAAAIAGQTPLSGPSEPPSR